MNARALVLVLVVPAALPAAANAETAPAAPPPAASASVADSTWRDRLVVEGLLDVYYAYQAGGSGVQSLAPHVFDDEGNSFTLAYAKLGLGVTPEPIGLRLDLGFGHVADVIASDRGAPDADSIRPVEQAYLTFAPPTRVPSRSTSASS